MTTGPCMSVVRSSDSNLTSMTGRYQRQKVPLVVRGVSRGSTETESIHSASLDDPFFNFLSVYRDEPISKELRTTPVTSGRSSPTELCRASHYDLAMAGNTTDRSSLYSSYSWADDISWGDEYDRRASSNVRSLFEEIDSVLFAEANQSSSGQSSVRSSNLQKECQEWMSQFPHLRVTGVGMIHQPDMGFQVIPMEKSPPDELLFSEVHSAHAQDTQSLTISGKHMVTKLAPRQLSTSEGQDPTPNDPYAFLHEEVFAQDGYYEEIIALDYKTEHEIVTARNPRRAARRGLPPLTPNACVRDSVVSMTFDMAWSEIVSWMRDVLRLYLDYVLSENAKYSVPPLEIVDADRATLAGSPLQTLPLESIPLTHDNSFCKFERRSLPTVQSYFTGQSNQALAGVLTISTKALQSREKSNLHDSIEPQSSREVVRHGSGLTRLLHHHRPSSVKVSEHVIHRLSSARKGPVRVRLAPLDRSKTPNLDDDPRREMGNQVLVGRRLQMFPERQQQTNNERLSSPSYMFRSALPPIGLGESESINVGSSQRNQRNGMKSYLANRASSALAEKEIARPTRERERSLVMPQDNRPSTTHTFRSDTPFAISRRSATPMGFSTARGSLQPASNHVSSGPGGVNQVLKIAGNSIGNTHSNANDVSPAQHQLDEEDEEDFHELQRWDYLDV